MFVLILSLLLSSSQCKDCNKEEIKGVYINVIPEYEYNLILKAEQGEIYLVDKRTKEYFFQGDLDLNPVELVKLIKKDHQEFVKTSKDWSNYYQCLEYFCNKNQFPTKFKLHEINYKLLKSFEINDEKFFYYIEKVRMTVLKKEVPKTPLNIFYINPNVKLSDTAKTITLYLATEVKGY